MIHISVETRKGAIVSLEVAGHSESAPYGQDLVCSAVSAILFGLCNACDELLKGNAQETAVENRITIRIHKPDSHTQDILRTGLIQLMTVQEQNKEFMHIESKEVQ